MDIHNLTIAHHHINLVRALKDYHIRHYIWEVAKVLIPVFITGLITVIVMRGNENRNKKRWLNDGHLRRKTELEIGIRKFLLGIKENVLDEYYALADGENEETAPAITYQFNKDFETLVKQLQNEEQKKGTDIYKDESIFALMSEYVCYVPKMQPLFDDFKSMSSAIIKLGEGDEEAADLKDKANIYLCFQDVSARILKKLMTTKIK